MRDRDLFIDYRIRVVRLGLAASWVALIAFAIVTQRDDGFDNATLTVSVAALAGVLLILTFIPWRRALARPIADGVILVWSATAIGAILFAEGFRTGDAVVAAFLAIVVFASAMLVTPIVLALVGIAALGGYVTALAGSPGSLDQLDLVVRIAAFSTASFMLLVAARGIRNEMQETASRLVELGDREASLARRESELERLYEISSTIGSGSKLKEVLPELVGRVVTAVGAKTGVVLLYEPSGEQLRVMSPIWVAGRTVVIDEYALDIADNGVAQRVFTSGVGARAVAEVDATDTFLANLDAVHVAAVPLRLEARGIGVLVVADKVDGNFTAEDLELLQSLAGPSALVLDHMSRYEQAQVTSEKMAELARLKTDFVSVVSHELRTPLTSIIGSLKTLQRPELSPVDPNAVELLATAERQAQRLRSLIEDLLVVSRIDNQALPVRPVMVDLERFLGEVVTGIPGARPMVSIEIEQGAEKVHVDSDHLNRMVSNLIENALRYAPGSDVELRADAKMTEVWVSVADHGPGIPYDLHEHVFDRFTQIDRQETRGHGGTGLGLSIVRGLAEAMGGRVWFEPTEGGGATFVVSLPTRARHRG